MPLIIAVVVILAFYYLASRGDHHEQQVIEDAEDELLRLCLGNRKQAERLLGLEVAKAPGIERDEAVRRAIRSFKRDLK